MTLHILIILLLLLLLFGGLREKARERGVVLVDCFDGVEFLIKGRRNVVGEYALMMVMMVMMMIIARVIIEEEEKYIYTQRCLEE